MSKASGLLSAVADTGHELIVDRRKNERHQATYRPCCVIASQKVTMGLIRNSSIGGARIEVDADLDVGDKLSYFWETNSCINARVAWREGNNFGLEHLDNVRERRGAFPSRSVRVPCKATARCWIDGAEHNATIENISIGGMRLSGLKMMAPGSLLSISFCGIEFEAVSIRWSSSGQTGVRFARPITREILAQLLLDDRFRLTCIQFAQDGAEPMNEDLGIHQRCVSQM
ncbi:PilZ domain-containing protein [Erythrobacter rubeus]|uniref:PilZ domain-containing protein n=1 Tax=Erythrobacter rubeus TaxID=2760803 RepID=A0ABR8KK76_9SPHN|nr:PilZ domain-containing protein [Erythrobacter rubeus]MBD2840636.1 PilZ domain-containing protein [Erythrobacter rubeus]